ncbi:Glucuronic Acid Substitution of Xylan 4, plant glycogenin-like starch initiation protein 4 [Hibiscus trionum]|uniref:Hexosyltransferase n=1 Tax=Hibiscus trionum TaxID=183268 RepID=A0A9W7LJ68_HIBTR|nr:Glucuronic Acid Substitution of Xylan 4, plant glycogenin-like starch initiation protein 4 [Hibiscus trionum]
MAAKTLHSNQKLFTLSLVFLSFLLLTLISFFGSKHNVVDTLKLEMDQSNQEFENPRWFDLIQKEFDGNQKIKVGFVNFNNEEEGQLRVHGYGSIVSTVHVHFDRVSKTRKWEDFFPVWINEDPKSPLPTCPEIPLPRPEKRYRDLDVVVARVPCEGWTSKVGMRDVFRLQVNLVVATLLVRSGWATGPRDKKREVYAVLVDDCGPMPEIFRCDDLLRKEGNHWVFKPELRRLKQKLLMPLGTCQIAYPFGKTDDAKQNKVENNQFNHREAYVTVLHSSEAYVCGAISLAQSIIRTNSTKDLLLLHDGYISPKSLTALRSAGWKTLQIERIRSPFAEKGSYNEWNYSKLRIWILALYHKVVFIDSDLLVLKNLDSLFLYPQLSAAANDKTRFNSGIMVIEPSLCTFEDLMAKSFKLDSYNGGDQGFLNEVFTWWHRLPSHVNFLKYFEGNRSSDHETIPDDVSAIHYLGWKPWMCYRDYDCNWDSKERQVFASDKAHEKWWQVYDEMPERLQQYCRLTPRTDRRIKKSRKIAKNLRLPDEHWKIGVTDPRQYNLVR